MWWSTQKMSDNLDWLIEPGSTVEPNPCNAMTGLIELEQNFYKMMSPSEMRLFNQIGCATRRHTHTMMRDKSGFERKRERKKERK